MNLPELKICFPQWLGEWDSNTTYKNESILLQPGVYFTLPVVTYNNSAYVMNNTSLPVKGVSPDSDSAWTLWEGTPL